MRVFRPRATALLSFVVSSPYKELAETILPPGWDLRPALAIAALAQPAVDLVSVVPRSITVRRNPYYEADEITLEIDYNTFPFDPRLAENVRIEAWMANAPAIDSPQPGPGNGTLLFVGHADDGRWQASSENVIHIRGRDHTALLADVACSGERTKREEPLDVLIREILDRLPATRDLRIEVRGLDGPVPNPFLERVPPHGNTHSSTPSESLWDLINQLAAQSGLVTYIEADTLVLAPGQVARDLDGPLFVYGENLTDLSVERVWGASRAPVVECVSWDPMAKMVRTARYPALAAPSSTGDGTTRPEKIVRYTFDSVSSDEALARAARNIHLRRQREDIKVQFTTHDMEGYNGENLLELKAGMPVQIYFSSDEKQTLHGAPVEERIRFLLKRGYPPKVADAIARGYDDLLKLFQVTTAEHRFKANDGYTLRCETASYLTAG